MARWRGEAIRRLPRLSKVIASAECLSWLWIDLELAFAKAYRADPRDESIIAGVYAFADWCLQAPRDAHPGRDPVSAAILFYEFLVGFRPARDDMPRWFKYEEVAQNKEWFVDQIGDEAYEALLRHMARNRGRYRPRERDSAARAAAGDQAAHDGTAEATV
jgi:hypothetical protein